MMEEYEITGHFYVRRFEGQDESFRSVLDIKHKTSKKEKPDFLVVMMNPGSSKPLDDNYLGEKWELGRFKKYVAAKPDRTQWQIVRLMSHFDYSFFRVINLSDFRNSKSTEFYQKLRTFSDDSHSIFSRSRQKELEEYLDDNIPVIAAWGLSSNLLLLAKMAQSKLERYSLIGVMGESDFAFRHPLPPSSRKQKEWLDAMIVKISGL